MRIKLVFLCGALALALSGGAAAQSASGFYGGVGIGKAKATLKTEDFTFNQAGVSESKDELDTTYKFLGGYRLGRFLAAEVAYADFGKFAYIYNASALGLSEERLNYKAKSWSTSALGFIPLGSSGFSVLARLGVSYNIAERSAFTGDGATVAATAARPSATKKKAGLLWGVGTQYDFSPNLGLRFEYADYGNFGQATSPFPGNVETGRARIHAYSLDFIGRF